MIATRKPLTGDIELIGKDAAEEWVRNLFVKGADFSGLLANPNTTVATCDGKPVAVGGYFERDQDNAIAWSMLGRVAPEKFVGLVRVFRENLRAQPYRWIEAHCIAAFVQSHRWVRCLGFEPVNGERCFTPDGREFRKFVFWNGGRNGT